MQIDSLLGSLNAAASGMEAQSLRLRLATENLSNADTPGYQRKLITFRVGEAGVEPGRVSLDRTEGTLLFDPAHPLADADGTVELSNVNMLIEMADAREAGRSYDANLQVFTQARRLYDGLLSVLKR
ncbi:flagellar basal body rod C-terminal domain-containing protein [Parvularcula sp. LCG005]|uniref:flagellar basal body rod C-terminal domain-containing protein n=1 Tax=Parvularcula sp. LCG005 TaxID=3078805 RepID=UPI0029426873|nr:flagellar basal body rod C-terminal domain-containing protein [Parvularcula sp. LCG005]WOI52945.1 flagellar basal body rod C-terminal domain-containing protein [Parvularcula sp. LCG005]